VLPLRPLPGASVDGRPTRTAKGHGAAGESRPSVDLVVARVGGIFIGVSPRAIETCRAVLRRRGNVGRTAPPVTYTVHLGDLLPPDMPGILPRSAEG